MRNLVIILAILLFGIPVFAEEVQQPAQEAENNTATIAVQKQPATESTHKQGIHQNKWCIIIQVNGKVKENGTSGK